MSDLRGVVSPSSSTGEPADGPADCSMAARHFCPLVEYGGSAEVVGGTSGATAGSLRAFPFATRAVAAGAEDWRGGGGGVWGSGESAGVLGASNTI
jgi:hypothetical protein